MNSASQELQLYERGSLYVRVVCDNGTGFVKCGYAGSNFPAHIFPSMVGRPIIRAVNKIGDIEVKLLLLRGYAFNHSADFETLLLLRGYAFNHSADFETVRIMKEKLCYIGYNIETEQKLALETTVLVEPYTSDNGPYISGPKECKILLTEPPMNPIKNREKMIEVMFEKYGFNSAYIAIQAMLTLYAQGLLSGVVVDSGDGVTHICPVYEQFALPHLTRRLDIAGESHITRYFMFRNSDASLVLLLVVLQMSSILCIIMGNPCQSDESFNHIVLIRTSRSKHCTGALISSSWIVTSASCFATNGQDTVDPAKVLVQAGTLTDLVSTLRPPHLTRNVTNLKRRRRFVDFIDGDEYEKIKALERNIYTSRPIKITTRSGVRTGKYGLDMTLIGKYPGLPSRLERQLYLERVLKNDIDKLSKFKIRIEDPPRRKDMVFIGGAVLAEVMKDRDAFWMSNKEYQERGVSVLSKLGNRAE
ncbi:actin-related protein 2-like [Diaphorina citri]|uniref:Actin-related protein 2-like n=1 Tax=Diaphorina citri TaxID=121845 RepID=A0A3Q0IX39_DIACI|nr:actin-related protein 2-like [Diaphorina citri]